MSSPLSHVAWLAAELISLVEERRALGTLRIIRRESQEPAKLGVGVASIPMFLCTRATRCPLMVRSIWERQARAVVCALNECCKVLEELKTRTNIQLVIRVIPGVSQPLSPPLHNPSQQAPRAGPKREPSRSHDQRSLALISVASDSSNSSRRPPSRHLRVGSSLASLHSQ